MQRRDFGISLVSCFFSSLFKKQKDNVILSPKEVGFDGSFFAYKKYIIKLARAQINHPSRYKINENQIVVWKEKDEVKKILYKNFNGKLFELKFVSFEGD
jgi:hypothetical protein